MAGRSCWCTATRRWGFLYRNFIGPLIDAGYWAIVPDHLGVGRSDKPTDPELYRIPRHVQRRDALLEAWYFWALRATTGARAGHPLHVAALASVRLSVSSARIRGQERALVGRRRGRDA